MIPRFDPIGSTNSSRGLETIDATQPPDQMVPTGAVLVHHLQVADSSRLKSRTHSVSRSAESFRPIRLYGIVDPPLNCACVEAIVVVVAAAVLAAVADVGDESLSCAAGPRIQENATA